jgi:very-short-patch-repair endonuclease
MDPRLEALAGQQGGLFTRAQARDLGLGDKVLYRLVREAELSRAAHGRYRLAEPESWIERVRAGLVLAGPGAIAARVTAASLAGIEGASTADEITLYVPPSGSALSRPGLSVIRSEVHPQEITSCLQIACTAALRTVIDCARFLPHANGVAIIEGAVRKGVVKLAQVTESIARLRHVEGAPAARRALLRVDVQSQSLLETEARLLLLDRGLEVSSQVELGRWHADLAIMSARLAIELQGGSHRSKEQHQEDETRRASFLASSWEVVGFTAEDVRRRPGYVVALVRRLVTLRTRD